MEMGDSDLSKMNGKIKINCQYVPFPAKQSKIRQLLFSKSRIRVNLKNSGSSRKCRLLTKELHKTLLHAQDHTNKNIV
jgi:hypothetical protein